MPRSETHRREGQQGSLSRRPEGLRVHRVPLKGPSKDLSLSLYIYIYIIGELWGLRASGFRVEGLGLSRVQGL